MKIYLLICLIISIHCKDINEVIGCAILRPSIQQNIRDILRALDNLAHENYTQVLKEFLRLFPIIKKDLKECLK